MGRIQRFMRILVACTDEKISFAAIRALGNFVLNSIAMCCIFSKILFKVEICAHVSTQMDLLVACGVRAKLNIERMNIARLFGNMAINGNF